MAYFLTALAKKLKKNSTTVENCRRIFVSTGIALKREKDEPFGVNILFKHIQEMLSGVTTMIAETGDSWFNYQKLPLPKNCGYEFQMLYGFTGMSWPVGATLRYEQTVSTIVGHTQCVSLVVWPQHGTIYSASWDHSIRRRDVKTGKDTLTMFRKKVINCIDVGGESSVLIATGSSDSILRIWDPRKSRTLVPIFQFSLHSSWISTCKWHDKSWFHLLPALYDRKLMLWELRTAWPLAVIDSHKDKVLYVHWWIEDLSILRIDLYQRVITAMKCPEEQACADINPSCYFKYFPP